MPLVNAQKDLIKNALIDQCSFPIDPIEFSEKENTLFFAFIADIDKNNEFYWLKECFINPSIYFQNIVTQGPTVTVGEVQAYILEYITGQLIATGNKPTTWTYEAQRNLIPEENLQIPFTSQKAAVETGENTVWGLPISETSIYTPTLRIEDEMEDTGEIDEHQYPVFVAYQSLYADIEITWAPNTTQLTAVNIQKLRGGFNSIEAENDYIEALKLKAISLIQKHAARLVINHLITLHKISQRTSGKALNSTPAHQLMTQRYYFDLLCTGKLKLATIINYSQEQADILCHPSIISLIQKEKISLKNAARLSQPQLKVLSHHVYHEVRYEYLKNLDAEHSLFLINPHVANLVSLARISFKEARKLPVHLIDILSNPTYRSLFTKGIVDWDEFSKIPSPQHKILNNPRISCLVINNVLDFNFICDVIEKNNGVDLLAALHFNAYIQRFQQLLANTPFQINSKLDTLEILLAEFLITANDCNTTTDELKTWVFIALLGELKADLDTKFNCLGKLDSKFLIFKNLCDYFPTLTTQANPDWSSLFLNLLEVIKIASEKLKAQEYISPQGQRITSPGASTEGLFSPARKKQRIVKDFHSDLDLTLNSIITLTTFNDMLAVQPTHRFAK